MVNKSLESLDPSFNNYVVVIDVKSDIIVMFFDGEVMSSDKGTDDFMATSSITANFAIRDKKEAKVFISAFLSDPRSIVPPARKRNRRLVDSVKDVEEDCHA